MFSIKISGCCDDCGCLLLTMTTMDMNGTMTTDCTILSKLHVCHGYIRKTLQKTKQVENFSYESNTCSVYSCFFHLVRINRLRWESWLSFFPNKRPSPVTINSQASGGTNEFLEVGRGPEGPKVATEAVSHPCQNKSTVETFETKRDIGTYMIGGCFLTCQVCFFCLQLITSWILNLSQKESLTFKLEPFPANKGHSLVIVRLRTHG